MSFDREIKSAIGAHGLWRTHLLSAIKDGYSDYTPAQVRQEDLCAFGQWLETIDDPTVRASPEYQKCAVLHRRFHAVTASVLRMALTGKKEGAREAVDVGGEFANASMEFTTAMLHWNLSVAASG